MTALILPFPNERVRACWNPPEQSAVVLILPDLHAPRECPKVQELRRQSKMLREHFKRTRPVL